MVTDTQEMFSEPQLSLSWSLLPGLAQAIRKYDSFLTPDNRSVNIVLLNPCVPSLFYPFRDDEEKKVCV